MEENNVLESKIRDLELENMALRASLSHFYESPYWVLANALVRAMNLVAPENTLRWRIVVFFIRLVVPRSMPPLKPILLLDIDNAYDIVASRLRRKIFELE